MDYDSGPMISGPPSGRGHCKHSFCITSVLITKRVKEEELQREIERATKDKTRVTTRWYSVPCTGNNTGDACACPARATPQDGGTRVCATALRAVNRPEHRRLATQ
jgi:hypothetical protein